MRPGVIKVFRQLFAGVREVLYLSDLMGTKRCPYRCILFALGTKNPAASAPIKLAECLSLIK